MPAGEEFDEVVRTFQDRVFRLCVAMLGDRALAEEAAQDTFVRVWKALPGFRGDSSLSTWIYSIARNTCLSARKWNSARRGLSLELPGVRRSAERALGGAETRDGSIDVLGFVAALPEHYRQVVLLYHMQEKSYDEVAQMLDLPLGTVKTYLHRARKQLAEAVAASNRPTMAERGRS